MCSLDIHSWSQILSQERMFFVFLNKIFDFGFDGFSEINRLWLFIFLIVPLQAIDTNGINPGSQKQSRVLVPETPSHDTTKTSNFRKESLYFNGEEDAVCPETPVYKQVLRTKKKVIVLLLSFVLRISKHKSDLLLKEYPPRPPPPPPRPNPPSLRLPGRTPSPQCKWINIPHMYMHLSQLQYI